MKTAILKFLSKFISFLYSKDVTVSVTESHNSQIEYLTKKREKLIDRLEAPSMTCVDVGARHGPQDLLLRYKKSFNFILIEPDQEEAERLREKGYHVIPSLMGDAEGTAVMYLTRRLSCSSILNPDGPFKDMCTQILPGRLDVTDTVELPIQRLDKALNEIGANVEYLKLDTQGAELSILNGLGDYRPLVFQVEVWFEQVYQDSCTLWDIANLLRSWGYLLADLEIDACSFRKDLSKRKIGYLGAMPLAGEAYFIPNWKSEKGLSLIKERDKEFSALMIVLGLEDLLGDIFADVETKHKDEILAACGEATD